MPKCQFCLEINSDLNKISKLKLVTWTDKEEDIFTAVIINNNKKIFQCELKQKSDICKFRIYSVLNKKFFNLELSKLQNVNNLVRFKRLGHSNWIISGPSS